jgi:hypothetical protein
MIIIIRFTQKQNKNKKFYLFHKRKTITKKEKKKIYYFPKIKTGYT